MAQEEDGSPPGQPVFFAGSANLGFFIKPGYGVRLCDCPPPSVGGTSSILNHRDARAGLSNNSQSKTPQGHTGPRLPTSPGQGLESVTANLWKSSF